MQKRRTMFPYIVELPCEKLHNYISPITLCYFPSADKCLPVNFTESKVHGRISLYDYMVINLLPESPCPLKNN